MAHTNNIKAPKKQGKNISHKKQKSGQLGLIANVYRINRLELENILKNADVLLLEMIPGKIEQSIIAGTLEMGITYIPAPDPALEYCEIGSFEMGIFGNRKWEDLAFSEWPFAIPTTELKIHSTEIDSLDMWPKTAPKRNLKYQFELLETALQTSRSGLSVLHCPDFIVKLQNRQVKAEFQLVKLSFPLGYRSSKPTKVYLVARKGSPSEVLERKLAKFMRSLKY